MLGLDENVAGVTFLAFGNGSPDLFSTFSAMRAGSGSLAVGELLGAATFIVSCVVGSMCIIKPFHVHRAPFLRDVGFFTLSVGMVLLILYDGQVRMLESGLLVVIYLTYVTTVVVGTWWENRKTRIRQREALIRNEYGEDTTDTFPPYLDERTWFLFFAFHFWFTVLQHLNLVQPKMAISVLQCLYPEEFERRPRLNLPDCMLLSHLDQNHVPLHPAPEPLSFHPSPLSVLLNSVTWSHHCKVKLREHPSIYLKVM